MKQLLKFILFIALFAYNFSSSAQSNTSPKSVASFDFIPSVSELRDTLCFNVSLYAEDLSYITEAIDTIQGITAIDVIGYASFEGSVDINTTLSHNRARSIAKAIARECNVRAGGENWVRLTEIISLGGMDEKEGVLEIISSTEDLDQRERELRNFNEGRAYEYIAQNYLGLTRGGRVIIICGDSHYNKLVRSIRHMDIENARKYVDKLPKTTNNPEIINSLGAYYTITQKYRQAQELYQRASELGNSNAAQNLKLLEIKLKNLSDLELPSNSLEL